MCFRKHGLQIPSEYEPIFHLEKKRNEVDIWRSGRVQTELTGKVCVGRRAF